MSTNTTPDGRNKRWSPEEENKLKSLVLLVPVVNDQNAHYRRKQEAWEGIAIMMESRNVQQCKTKWYNLKRYDNQEGESLSTTNLPSYTLASTNVDNKNIRWSKDEENKLNILISLNPIVRNPNATTQSKQDAWEIIAKKIQSRTVEQCKSRFYLLNKECSNQGGGSSETNPPSSAVGLPSPSTSTGINTSQICSSTSETPSRTASTKHRSSDIENEKGNKIRKNNEIEDPMQHFFQSILNDIKKLSQDKQMAFKQKVMEVIVELSKDE